MRPSPKDPSPRERLREIVKTMRDCNQDVNRALVMEQFRYETGRFPTRDELKDALE